MFTSSAWKVRAIIFAYFQDAVINTACCLAVVVAWKIFWPLLGWWETRIPRERPVPIRRMTRDEIEMLRGQAIFEANREPDEFERSRKLARAEYEHRLRMRDNDIL